MQNKIIDFPSKKYYDTFLMDSFIMIGGVLNDIRKNDKAHAKQQRNPRNV